MSFIDINRIVESLISNKVKERNEALDLFDSLSASKFSLNPKSFRMLTKAIFKLIENESTSYYHSKSSAADLRLSRASNSMRILTERSIHDTKVRLTHKNYIELTTNVIQNFMDDRGILFPCAIDFTKLLSNVLKKKCFVDHLTEEEWNRFYNFLLMSINFLLKESNSPASSINESVISELFSSLQSLLRCDYSISTNFLPLLLDSRYLKLIDLLQLTVKNYKKENSLIIIIFRILNKLIVILSTQDINSVNKLIQMGINILISFYQTQWESLQIQFLIFLNMSSTHRFLNLKDLSFKKSEGGDSYLENSYENNHINTSDLSPINRSLTDDNSKPSDSSEDNFKVLLYNIGVLIQNLIGKANTIDFQFNEEQIHSIVSSTQKEKTWFRLRSIYLKSSDFRPWLLNLGLAKLINSYFDLKQTLQNILLEEQADVTNILRSQTKRQKLDIISTSLYNSNNVLEFCNKLISYKSDPKTQQLGLQLLTFYVEAFDLSTEEDHESGQSLDSKDLKSNTQASIDPNNSTVISIFGFPIHNNKSDYDINVILKSIMNTFDNAGLHFWGLNACKSLYSSFFGKCERYIKKIHSKYSFQLLKISLPLLKYPFLSDLSSNLLYLIFSCHSNENLSTILDKSVIAQFDNLIDLSEINGPFSISNESFQFWYSIYNVVHEINLLKRDMLIHRIQDWLLSKWDNSLSGTGKIFDANSGLPSFIAWLCGASVHVQYSSCLPSLYEGSLNEAFHFSKSFEALENFISEDLFQTSFNITFTIHMESIGENKHKEMLLVKVIEHMKQYILPEKLIHKFEWTVLLLNLSDLLQGHAALSNFITSIDNQCLQVLASFSEINFTSELSLKVIESFNEAEFSNSSCEFLNSNFPFLKLISEFPFVIHKNKGHELNSPKNTSQSKSEFFDEEFEKINFQHSSISDLKSVNSQPFTDLQLKYQDTINIKFLKFVFLCGSFRNQDDDTILSSLLTEIDNLGPQDVIYCLNYLLNLFELKKINLSEVTTSTLTKLVRILGEGPLADPDLDRAELTIIVVSKITTQLLDFFIISTDIDFKKDCYDICKWLLECGKMNLLITEASFSAFCKFLLKVLVKNDDTVLHNNEIEELFLQKFILTTNNIKIEIAPSIMSFMRSSTVNDQMALYKNIFKRFSHPEYSIESSASYSLFFFYLSKSSSHIMITSVFNLLECSKFSYFIKYLKLSIKLICNYMQFANPRVLFGRFKVELLRYWWCFNKIKDFPYTIFDYESLEVFYTDNYKELAAISMSTKSNINNSTDEFLSEISSVKGIEMYSLFCDSLILSIPLSFTRNGIRNEIFEILPKFLKKTYKEYLGNKILIIAFEIIKYTNLVDELQLLDEFKGSKIASKIISKENTFLIEPSGDIFISLRSSMDLLNILTSKYYDGEDMFWSVRSLYFLIRRVSLLLRFAISSDQKISILRKLKLLLIMGNTYISRIEITKLLIKTLCPLLNEEKLRSDVNIVLSVCQFQVLSGSNELRVLPLVVELLSSLIKTSCKAHPLVLQNIQNYVNNFDHVKKIHPILMASLSILRNEEMELSSSMIESLLDDENELSYFTNEMPYLIELISEVFKCVCILDEVGRKQNVANFLLNIDGEDFRVYSKKFGLWAANYLSNCYMSGEIVDKLSKIVLINEYSSFDLKSFELSVRSMDFALNKIIQYFDSPDFEIAACAESILGVLIWKYELPGNEISKFLNFKKYYENYKEYLSPFDFHSCILLNSSSVELDFLGDNLQDIVKNLKHSILNTSFEIWTSKLLLAFIQEIARFTSIAPLFSNFIIKVNSYAQEVLPYFVCYYIYLRVRGGVELVVSLVNEFISVHCKNNSFVSLFSRIIQAIRIESVKNEGDYRRIYSMIHVAEFINQSIYYNLFKSSLMLFEDCYSEGDNDVILRENSEILSDIYESIDDEDLIYGLPEQANLEYALKMVNELGNNTDQVEFNNGMFDASISLSTNSGKLNVLNAMKNRGLMGISRIISKDSNVCEIDDSYEWAWKLNSWELPIPSHPKSEHASIYRLLKQLYDYPQYSFKLAEDSILDLLYTKNERFTKTLGAKELKSQMLGWFRTISTISSIGDILACNSSTLVKLSEDYMRQTSWFENSDFAASETVLLARHATFKIIADYKVENSNESDLLWISSINDLARYNSLARTSKQIQKMVNSTILIDQISKSKFLSSSLSKSIDSFSKFYAASTLWEQGQTRIPVTMLKDLQQEEIELPLKSMNISQSLINATLVGWIAESRQDLPSNIMDTYVTPTLMHVVKVEDLQQKFKIYQYFAHFCEKQFRSRNLVDQILKLDKRITAKKAEIEEIKSYYGKTSVSNDEKRTVQRYYSKLKSSYLSDLSEMEALKAKKNEFSNRSVEFYLKCISIFGDKEEELDKFFALWLEFSDKDELNSLIKDEILNLPTFNFISWATQLISRLSSDTSVFQTILKIIIVKMCFDHPYHSLYYLMSLRIHDSHSVENSIMKSKYVAANKIWGDLLSKDEKYVKKILMAIEKFCQESVKLAAYKVSRGKTLNIEKLGVGKYWMEDLPSLPPPTMTIDIDYTTNYKDLPNIVSISSEIQIATSGLSLPKIATLITSSGIKHKMLLKYGTDDLRQDSIMEQVFEKVNNLFNKNRDTRKRHLNIRTYKAIPLGPQAGIIEYVPNSVAFIDAMKPYHIQRDKLKLDKARELMKNSQSDEKSERIRVYEKICLKINPVLRYFFFDNFVTPDKWFNSRTSYTRGIATTSMVGHVLGLGDRHCNNILLDTKSGEPIHIDLGVAFDQGKRLPIPETVPFRLTRDIVDGFGINGVEGSFKKSSEHTFKVLRENKDHILAILDVLRWDPLYSWTLSTIRKRRLQDEITEVAKSRSEDGDSEAWNAISTVSDKLIAEGLSVEASVRELVQEATNTQNLALIYFGWCPFF